MGKTRRRTPHGKESLRWEQEYNRKRPWYWMPPTERDKMRFRATTDKFLQRDGLGKHPYGELYSGRPMGGCAPGSSAKRMCNRIERREAKQELHRQDDHE